MNLLLDLGNSRLKWAGSENNSLSCHALTHSEITPQTLRTVWRELQPQHIGISSVGNHNELTVITDVIFELWQNVPVHFMVTTAHALGVTNGYLQPEKLGVDRWLALIAAWQINKSPLCVVDCGTAITVDILNEKGVHQGGLICVGLTLMKTSLARNTANLPLTHVSYHPKLAINTEDAIASGALFAACGLIEKVMQQQPVNTTLFLTGGDAETISTQLNRSFILDKNLVLQGIALLISK